MEILGEACAATKRFGAFTAVSGVDLTVGRGEVVGLLGANGAGKTTLIRLLLGLLRPSSGAVRLFDTLPSLATRRRVGYVPQTLGLYDGLTVAENWRFTTSAFGSNGATLPRELVPWEQELVADLPLGAQRQVAFSVALSHQPELLILDEPTSGAGPLASARLWERIRQAADEGAGVLVTTHNMEEAEQCDRLVVMAGGQVVAAGTATGIISGREAAEVHSGDPGTAFAVLDAAGFAVQVQGSALRVAAQAAAVAELLARAGIRATVEPVPANLEEAFVALVARPTAR